MNHIPLRAVIFTGGFCNTSLLTAEELTADLYIAADAGWHTAETLGIMPHVTAGDFDSSDMPPESFAGEIIRVPAEKDDTDTMLACELAIERGARELLILGGTGGRLDHTLSNVFLLENHLARGVRTCLTDGENRIHVLHEETLTLPCVRFRYFSLLALTDAAVTIRGCKYPLTDAPLSRANPYAVSNEITGDAAEITVRGGPVLLIESDARKF